MSQYSSINYKQIIQQQQEQLVVIQTQLQVLLAAQGAAAASGTGVSTEVAEPQLFDRTVEKVLEFVIACKLFIRIKMREEVVEK